MKDEDYFVYNQKKGMEEIAKQLKFINWNMGRVVSFLEGNPTLLEDIKKQMAETEAKENAESSQ